MTSAAPSLRPITDPVAALAACVCDNRPLLMWAVEFTGREDPLPRAWEHSRDAIAMAVTLALADPRVFVDAIKSIARARLPNAAGDALEVLVMFPDAIRARMLPALVRDARRMLRRLPGDHREMLEAALCSTLRRATPEITFDRVIDAMRDRS